MKPAAAANAHNEQALYLHQNIHYNIGGGMHNNVVG